MDSHLSHKLPWKSFDQVLKIKRDSRTAARKEIQLGLKEIKVVYHFARCFSATISEFTASDASPDDERRAYNPTIWGLATFSRPYGIGYYDSLIEAYIALNLLLMGPHAFPRSNSRYYQDWEGAACGWGRDAHSVWLTSHLR